LIFNRLRDIKRNLQYIQGRVFSHFDVAGILSELPGIQRIRTGDIGRAGEFFLAGDLAQLTCKEVNVNTDASKFGKAVFAFVASLGAVKKVITDSRLRRDVLSRLEAMGIEVRAV